MIEADAHEAMIADAITDNVRSYTRRVAQLRAHKESLSRKDGQSETDFQKELSQLDHTIAADAGMLAWWSSGEGGNFLRGVLPRCSPTTAATSANPIDPSSRSPS